MSKKSKITINRSESLDAVDQELNAAMDMLDGANDKVVELLHSYEENDEAGDNADDLNQEKEQDEVEGESQASQPEDKPD